MSYQPGQINDSGFILGFFYVSQLEGSTDLKALPFSEAINRRFSSHVANMQLRQEYLTYHG